MKLMPSCREVSELLSRAQDRPLTLAERFGLYVHLPLCHACRSFGRQLEFMRRAAREYWRRDS